MGARKTKRPIRASPKVRQAMETLMEPKKRKSRANGIKRKTGDLRKKGKPVRLCDLCPLPDHPIEFFKISDARRGRLIRLSPMGATVEFDSYEVTIRYGSGSQEVRVIPREVVVISDQVVVQEVR